jgi:hypothetical protein
MYESAMQVFCDGYWGRNGKQVPALNVPDLQCMVQLQVALRPTCAEKETDSPRAAAARGMAPSADDCGDAFIEQACKH